MGQFDVIHGGTRCAQVKCLGRWMTGYIPGDKVALWVKPSPEREAELDSLYLEGDPTRRLYSVEGEPTDTVSWQIKTNDGYIQFVDGVFTEWTDEAARDLLVVDNFGQPASEVGTIPSTWAWAGPPSDDEDWCLCSDVRAGLNGWDTPWAERHPNRSGPKTELPKPMSAQELANYLAAEEESDREIIESMKEMSASGDFPPEALIFLDKPDEA